MTTTVTEIFEHDLDVLIDWVLSPWAVDLSRLSWAEEPSEPWMQA